MFHTFKFQGAKIIVVLTVFSLIAAADLVAEDKRSTAIEPYLDRDTAFVGWLDVNEVDLLGLQAFALKYDVRLGTMQNPINFQKAFRAVGIRHLFAVATFADMTKGGPLFVLPCRMDQAEDVRVVVATTLANEGQTVVVHGNNVLVGSSDVVNRYLAKPSAQPAASLIAEINGTELANAAIVQVPTAAAMFLSPVMPDLIKGLDLQNPPDIQKIGQIVMSTQTVSFSSSLPPKQARLKVEMSTGGAADEMSRVVNQIIGEKASGNSDSLTMRANGNTVSLDLANEQAVTSAMDGLMQILAPARLQARQSRQMNSVKQIGLAMHNFHSAYGHFPPQSLSSKSGKKLLSWRVLILPFLDQSELYQKFKLDEPWDSEHNIKLVSEIPFVYSNRQPSDSTLPDGKTRLQVPLLENSVFGRSGGGASFREITDGTSNTVMVVQVPKDKAVIWTKPNDAVVDPANPAAALVDPSQERFLAGFCDGSVRRVLATVSNKTLLALLTMNGGEIVDTDEL